MLTFFRGVLISVVLGTLTGGSGYSSRIGTRSAGISVHVVQPQHAFGQKDSIPLHVDVSNEDKQTLLVCSNLESSEFCSLVFEARDAAGHQIPTVTGAPADRGEGTPEPFPNVLISNWVALAPHYTYGTIIDFRYELGVNLRPGHYKVKAILSSDGPAALVYDDLRHYPEELAALPFPGWKGKVESNWVSIEIVASK